MGRCRQYTGFRLSFFVGIPGNGWTVGRNVQDGGRRPRAGGSEWGASQRYGERRNRRLFGMDFTPNTGIGTSTCVNGL